MKSYIIVILFLVVNQLTAQIPILNTNWYLTQIEENNQIDIVPISVNGTTGGNWFFSISHTPIPTYIQLTSNYCSEFIAAVNITSTDFTIDNGKIILTMNMPCDWMTNEEIQYFGKYYDFFENYRNNTFTYIINNFSGYSELIITNNAGNKAYYSTVPLANIKENELEQFIKVYPIPFADHFFVEDSKEIIKEIKIFDNTGKLIKTVLSPNPLQEIYTDFSSGIYHINIKTKDGRIMNKKMIKK
jgi:hypothetical protein